MKALKLAKDVQKALDQLPTKVKLVEQLRDHSRRVSIDGIGRLHIHPCEGLPMARDEISLSVEEVTALKKFIDKYYTEEK